MRSQAGAWEREANKIDKAIEIKRTNNEIEHISKKIKEISNIYISNLDNIILSLKKLEIEDNLKVLEEWKSKLEEYNETLNSPTDSYLRSETKVTNITNYFAPDNFAILLNSLTDKLKAALPDTTIEQTAWDVLTRLEENYKIYETAVNDLNKAEIYEKRADLLYNTFIESRDDILGTLYDNIKNKFVELYIKVHGEDEKNFNAILKSDDASLNLEVDFYGKGNHPPHALHSEGHQDTMGLCLYLTMNEYLTSGIIDVTILDDVVMSVDAEHRRAICTLLATEFPYRQFLITTHDRTWANQLKTEGVVKSKNMIEFYNWSVANGPQTNQDIDIWGAIDDHLKKNEISDAAAKLRKYSEQFFTYVCDDLEAKVTYRLSQKWELGDLLPAAYSRYKSILGLARKAAQSWNNTEFLEILNELDATAKQIYTRTNAEQWAVNSNVHYNSWTNFSKTDFKPVVESFKDLFSIFICSKCSTPVKLISKDKSEIALKCNCNAINWNLEEKKKK